MLRRLLALIAVVAVVSGVVVWRSECFPEAATVPPGPTAPLVAVDGPPIGPPLYAVTVPSSTAAPYGHGRAAPIVLPECRLTVLEKQDVPSQRDGIVLFIGTEIEQGQQVPPQHVVAVRLGGQEQCFARLREGDVVKPGQLLAYLDDQLSRDDWAIKKARVSSNQADLDAALKTSEESKNRYDTQLWLRREGHGATAEEDVRAAKLAWDKAAFDAVAKREAVTLAERELSQSETVLRMHQVRSTTAGVIKAIHKKPGEAVKAYEPVVEIQKLDRLRVEGLVDVCHLPRLRVGMNAVIEPSQPEAPQQLLLGHLQDITSVAVGQVAGHAVIVSTSEDGTARVWDRESQRERRVLVHPAPVLAVACSPNGLCLTGAADGHARLWKLDASQDPGRELPEVHAGAVTCVAFSPDGRVCATGGEDREVCLFDTASGKLLYRLPAGHRGAVTSLQFTPRCQLVSAGRDNTLRLWTLGRTGAKLETTFDRRSGEVAQLGVSPDGGRVMYDQGNALRLLALPDGRTDGVVQNLSRASGFATCALFSPDSRFVLSATAEGRVQLWRAPTEATRAAEVRQLVGPGPVAATCAAFAPDGSFVVVGGRDRRLRVWRVPGREKNGAPIAEVVLIDPAVESSTHEARIWAEVSNPDGRWLPGTTVTMVIGEE